MNPSFALTEQIVRRAREIGGERVEVPIFLVQGGQTMTATVRWPAPDSVALTLAGSELRAATAGARLTHITVPAQNLTVHRIDGAHVAPVTVEPPDYSPPSGAPYTAEEVQVRTPAGHTLAGTLTRPATGERAPAVVLITGSGAQDRDQALPIVGGYRPFREFADTLSRRASRCCAWMIAASAPRRATSRRRPPPTSPRTSVPRLRTCARGAISTPRVSA